jgi:transcription-repair coupling factor (superfamily II helicase)
LTPLAKERLKALKEAEELGSGYKIALKDLELRGAGNILGKEQSGNINKVGLNLYCQMLAEAIEKLKAK